LLFEVCFLGLFRVEIFRKKKIIFGEKFEPLKIETASLRFNTPYHNHYSGFNWSCDGF